MPCGVHSRVLQVPRSGDGRGMAFDFVVVARAHKVVRQITDGASLCTASLLYISSASTAKSMISVLCEGGHCYWLHGLQDMHPAATQATEKAELIRGQSTCAWAAPCVC